MYPLKRLRSLDDVFPHCGISYRLSELILMDVILYCHLLQREGADGGSPTAPAQEHDVVVMVSASDAEDLLDNADYKYRTMIAFLPGAGVFYCARERRCGIQGGVDGALIQFDMSLREDVNAPPTDRRFSFGRDGMSNGLPLSLRADFNPHISSPLGGQLVATSML